MNIDHRSVVNAFVDGIGLEEYKTFPYSQRGELWINELDMEIPFESSYSYRFNLSQVLKETYPEVKTVPVANQNMSFYIPLGDMIDYVKFKNSIKVHYQTQAEVEENKAKNVSDFTMLNMQMPGINFRYLSRDYVTTNFIIDACPSVITNEEYHFSYSKCNLADIILPDFQLVLKNKENTAAMEMVHFTQDEALLKPTLVNNKMADASYAAYVMQMLTMDGSNLINITDAEGIFHFGMTFVQKYET